MNIRRISIFSLIVISYLAISFTGFAQVGQKVFMDSTLDISGTDIIILQDQSIVLLANVNSTNPFYKKFYLVKLNQNLDTVWTTSSDATLSLIGVSVEVDVDGGIIVFGHDRFFIDMFMCKFDSNGVYQWSRIFGGIGSDIVWCGKSYSLGGFVVCGNSQNLGIMSGIVVRLNQSGDTVWTRTIQDSSAAKYLFSSFSSDSSGNIYVAGYISTPSLSGLTLTCIDSSGELEWQKVFQTPNVLNNGYDILSHSDGNLLIVGSTDSTVSERDILIIKTDTAGNLIWSKRIEMPGFEIPTSVVEFSDSLCLVSAWMADQGKGCLFSMDNSGNLVWSRVYGSSINSRLYNVASYSGSIVATGEYDYLTNLNSAYVIRCDSSGFAGCAEHNITLNPLPSVLNVSLTVPEITRGGILNDSIFNFTSGMQEITLCAVGLSEDLNQSDFSVYPNPASDFVRIQLNGNSEQSIALLDCYGRMIQEQYSENKPEAEFGLEGLPAGIYYILLTSKESFSVKAFVVSNN